MKRVFLILLAGICSATLAGVNTFAATIIVDNNPSHDADYRTLQDAVDGASAGDTILIGPSFNRNSYGSLSVGEEVTITKKLYIYGTGYVIDENGYQGGKGTSIVGNILFKPLVGGDGLFVFDPSGSIISGVSASSIEIQGAEADTSDIIHDISITRNYCDEIKLSNFYYGGSQNHIISQNRVGNVWVNGHAAIIQNNIIAALPGRSGGLTCREGEVLVTNNSLSDSRMYFYKECSGEVFNNIAPSDSAAEDGSGVTIHHNYLSTESNFQNNVYTWIGSEDAKFQLKTGSLAKGACLNGADCGAFAGATPYILSGLPPRPRITNLELPATVLSTDTSMPIKVSAESRN
ncbi:hypothetical protein VU04_06435 [Desulfobulbus sp. TB]|nr:hypothetical protein [Desulfobulbus sp. TB]